VVVRECAPPAGGSYRDGGRGQCPRGARSHPASAGLLRVRLASRGSGTGTHRTTPQTTALAGKRRATRYSLHSAGYHADRAPALAKQLWPTTSFSFCLCVRRSKFERDARAGRGAAAAQLIPPATAPPPYLPPSSLYLAGSLR
jgi:hypothetical protein